MFAIIIGLIVALIIVAVVINAIQQHKEQVEAERRAQSQKLKLVIDETEDALAAAAYIPVSNKLLKVLHNRVLNALKSMQDVNPKAMDIKNRIKDAEERVSSINEDEPPPAETNFTIPENDKQVITLIQGIKKIRTMLRAENSKGKVDPHVFSEEDKRLDRMQLRVNVDTLLRRGKAALSGNMLGSARQYFEKALVALNAQAVANEYTQARHQEITDLLEDINSSLRDANAADRARQREENKDELDELFAPKKKW
ncbi:hypothetical protein HMF8227_01790 [Saliniradius amylolyticus]|uniref:DNA repair protein n=1 Tax=Saliniradius amylolyticus TaxID=2183582 RepID=A0A2S2E3Q3_9ALTE|nr:hypothetical protein [Saliniradius amylolyticus]AWL12263.1 hypothetical protein HMF8227_01790 [Saliniradius amylolyticus]